jgi:hypothetical protein
VDGLTEWITANANALSGYVILILGVVAFIWAMATGRLYMGKNVDAVLAGKDAQIASCSAALLQCQRPPQEVS